MEKNVDSGGVFSELLAGLSRALDCIPYNPTNVKLEAYSFQIDALEPSYGYLSNRKQRVKINKAFAFWKDIECSAPQRPILGPPFFNRHLCDLFYYFKDLDIACYADYTIIYTVKAREKSVMTAIETLSLLLFKWFINKLTKANSDKSHPS